VLEYWSDGKEDENHSPITPVLQHSNPPVLSDGNGHSVSLLKALLLMVTDQEKQAIKEQKYTNERNSKRNTLTERAQASAGKRTALRDHSIGS
jgi:hypothetical protein